MSQEKVDRYKKEKKNRAKVIKKKRARQYALILVGCALLGGIIGYPAGKIAYKINRNHREASSTVSAAQYDYWFDKYWNANITPRLGYPTVINDTTEADAGNTAQPEASGTDAE